MTNNGRGNQDGPFVLHFGSAGCSPAGILAQCWWDSLGYNGWALLNCRESATVRMLRSKTPVSLKRAAPPDSILKYGKAVPPWFPQLALLVLLGDGALIYTNVTAPPVGAEPQRRPFHDYVVSCNRRLFFGFANWRSMRRQCRVSLIEALKVAAGNILSPSFSFR